MGNGRNENRRTRVDKRKGIVFRGIWSQIEFQCKLQLNLTPSHALHGTLS